MKLLQSTDIAVLKSTVQGIYVTSQQTEDISALLLDNDDIVPFLLKPLESTFEEILALILKAISSIATTGNLKVTGMYYREPTMLIIKCIIV